MHISLSKLAGFVEQPFFECSQLHVGITHRIAKSLASLAI